MTPCVAQQSLSYSVYEIDLAKLSSPSGILQIMKCLGIKKYVYTFVYLDKIIKHGISVDVKSLAGDRIYRQAGHLDGWSSRLTGPCGADMVDINADYFAKTGEHLNRQGMKIIVRDLTNVSSPSLTDSNLHVKQLERQLIKEYINEHNCLPIGNIKDEAYLDNKTYVTKSVWNNLFEQA
jgi:hypothetical protein